jgi:serine/threonine protein kinase
VQEKKLSHCDLKPENVMMNNLIPIVIDFGAVTALGNEVGEYTPFYSLDAINTKVSPKSDFFFIVTLLVRCFVVTIQVIFRRNLCFVGV